STSSSMRKATPRPAKRLCSSKTPTASILVSKKAMLSRACPVSGVFAILRLYYAKYFSVVYEFPPVHASTSDFRPLARSFPPSCGHTHPLLSPDLCVVGG